MSPFVISKASHVSISAACRGSLYYCRASLPSISSHRAVTPGRRQSTLPHRHLSSNSRASSSSRSSGTYIRKRPPSALKGITMDSSPSSTGKPALTRDLTLPSHPSPSIATTKSQPPPPATRTPRLVYGTAWKKSRTASLVHAALRAGFRGIDTANQPRHYSEPLVGEGLRLALADGTISSRGEVFVQTKFTCPRGQDPPPDCPYDPADPLEKQVRDSVEGSFANLFGGGGGAGGVGTEAAYIDSLVLHSPMDTYTDTFAVWRVLETYVPHRIRHLGIANAPFEVIERLYHEATTTTGPGASGLSVPPSVVQNRFYAPTDYDSELRRWCRERGIVYQSFWTLTANNADMRQRGKVNLVGSEPVRKLAAAVGGGLSKEAAYYSLVLGLEGITILDGTTSEAHMREDLDGIDAVGRFAESSTEGKEVWGQCLAGFKASIGEEDDDY
ncbi:NADP-dependent oxidoreductase domain-containing protein [Microdochium bolleyi]|uniref:NADP-dependent oxidoreductase domain-containing protein n=1 Tax=Microdochium bolleyi TaxID=196109 RepID=A0A136JIF5_9PEZI|nr:NADP-dependent oxidoreductase domain-containing protein [Microdochium bolleyi]